MGGVRTIGSPHMLPGNGSGMIRGVGDRGNPLSGKLEDSPRWKIGFSLIREKTTTGEEVDLDFLNPAEQKIRYRVCRRVGENCL